MSFVAKSSVTKRASDEAFSSSQPSAQPSKRARSLENGNDGERDWVVNPDFHPFFLDDAAEDEDEDEGEEESAFGEENPTTRTYIPSRLLKHLDHRCGSPFFTMSLSDEEKVRRRGRFHDRIRRICRYLKTLVLTSSLFASDTDIDRFELFTKGFACLINNSDEDYLIQCFLSGVPDSTIMVLGKVGFTINDLLQLPRLSDSELSEHAVYGDFLRYAPSEKYDWRLYVGSGSSQFGALQRWFTYFIKNDKGTRHGRASRQPGRTMNLRCLAHYGFSPEVWLTTFAESVFMLYLGTIDDPGMYARTEKTSWFVHDDLYEAVKKLRSECELDEPVAKGLNSTWSFTQGWRGVGIKAGAKCVNCNRVVPHAAGPTFNRNNWYYANNARPAANHVKCKNCALYALKHGSERPLRLEEKRPTLAPKSKSTRLKTEICEHDSCNEAALGWCGKAAKWLCKLHIARANEGVPMDAPKLIISQSSREKPDICEYEECKLEAASWSGKVLLWLCKRHTGRAQNEQPMDAPMRKNQTKSKSTREKPDHCEYDRCDREVKGWTGTLMKYLCSAHISRAQQGTPMDAPMKAIKRTGKGPTS